MEQLRFWIGIGCLFVCLSFGMLALYIFPYLLWQLYYEVPIFVVTWFESLTTVSKYDPFNAAMIMMGILMGISVFFGFVAFLLTRGMEKDAKLIFEPDVSEKKPLNLKKDISLFSQLLLLGVVVFAILVVVQQFIFTTPNP